MGRSGVGGREGLGKQNRTVSVKAVMLGGRQDINRETAGPRWKNEMESSKGTITATRCGWRGESRQDVARVVLR
jgi:hypothetical protein